MVSVIIPSYNREKTIERAIKSVLCQSYKDLEIIVIDDCSTDQTERIVKELTKKDFRIKYHKLEKNSGACVARNVGIDMARGDYIAFQDSDDEWMPDKLIQQIMVMDKNGADISFCQLNKINYSDKAYFFPNRNSGFVKRGELLEDSIVSTQAIVAKKECFKNIRFDSDMPRYQDYDLCIRLSEKYDFYFLDKPLVNMYLQDDSITKDWNKMLIALLRIKRKYPDLISEYKSMRFYIYRMMYKAKKNCRKFYLDDVFRIFFMCPVESILLLSKKLKSGVVDAISLHNSRKWKT